MSAPQCRALCCQKWSEPGVFFLAFRLWNLLRATAACNFSSLISPDGPAPAALANLIYYYTFRPSGTTNHGEKHSDSRLFYLFARLHHLSSDPFFWLFLFSDLLSSSLLFFLFSSLILPTSVFSSVHTVGSLTFKLLSATCYIDMHAHTSTHTYIHAHEHKHLHQDKTRQHKDNTI